MAPAAATTVLTAAIVLVRAVTMVQAEVTARVEVTVEVLGILPWLWPPRPPRLGNPTLPLPMALVCPTGATRAIMTVFNVCQSC